MTAPASLASPEVLEAMRVTLRFRPRTPAWLRDVAKRYCASEAFVQQLAEALDTSESSVITESAPAEKERTTMAPRTPDERPAAVVRAIKAYRNPAPVVARILGVTEADAAKVVKGIVEASPNLRAITESGNGTYAQTAPDAGTTMAAAKPFTDHDRMLADKLADDVRSAMAKPLEKARTQDLEALAAAGSWF